MNKVRLFLGLVIALISLSVFAGYDEGLNAYNKNDYATALKEWQPLADQGHAGAQNNLGFMYENGTGVIQDYTEASKWYRKAAMQGNSYGQRNLGLFYRDGTLVNKNLIVAYAWLNLAATAGHPNASKERTELASQLSAGDLIQAQKLSVAWEVGQSIPEPKVQAKLKPTKKDAILKETAATEKPLKVKPVSNVTTKYTSCQNNCINGSCVRTFPDGKTERWQAPQVFDPFTSTFKWDTSSCG